MTTAEVVVRPLSVSDAEADYEALMSSRESLRVWEQGEWPSDDFTLEENRSDLKEHEDDHAAGRAFTYTVTDPANEKCLGCVYLYPLGSVLRTMGAGDADVEDVGDYEAYVTFWVRESQLAGGLERRLLQGLIDWLDRDWAFRRIAFGTNTADTRQMALLAESGFKPRWRFPVPGREAEYVVCLR
jgi:RimJ/RimL family protein N-acetyltransferase